MYDAVPLALRTRQTADHLHQALSSEGLIARGPGFIGRGEKLLAHLTGSSSTWSYDCWVWISLSPNGSPAGPVSLPKASMGTARKATGSLTNTTTLTTGPTVSTSATAGSLMGLRQPGCSATAGVSYKREKAEGHSNDQGHERSDTFSYGEGAHQYEDRGTVRVRIEWDKRRNALALWARGKAHKERALDSQDRTDTQVVLTYALPSALVPPRRREAGTSTNGLVVTGAWEI
ncbi:hypothetical protein [Streptomyces sp. NPDC055709]